MKIDLWTKIVFTIIAICLVILAVKSLQVIPARATEYVYGSMIIKVDLARIGGEPVFLYDFVENPLKNKQ